MIDYLASPMSKLLESAPFKSWPVERSIDDDLDARVIEYVFEDHGVEVQCDAKDEIATIFLTPAAGSNEALFDIPFSLTRAEVLSRLGKPSKSGEKSRDATLERRELGICSGSPRARSIFNISSTDPELPRSP